MDPGKIESYLSQKVRESVEETLNTLLEEEADRVSGAKRYPLKRLRCLGGIMLRF